MLIQEVGACFNNKRRLMKHQRMFTGLSPLISLYVARWQLPCMRDLMIATSYKHPHDHLQTVIC